MSTTDNDQKAFVRSLFVRRNDNNQMLRHLFAHDERQKQQADAAADDERATLKRFLKDLLRPADPDANVLAGLPHGKTTGIWRHPEPETEDKGRWFGGLPIADD